MNKQISQLIKSCLKRDREAEMELYNMYSRKIFNSCYRILQNREEAEEVMQDSFLKTFKQLKKFESCPERIEYFLKRVAINQAIDIIRKRKILFTELHDGISETYQEQEINEENPDIERIKEYILQLHSSQRLIITLKLIENLETKEIAQRLGISESTVRSQLMRGRNRLIEQLNNQQHGQQIRQIH